MPAGEISALLASLRAAADITKAFIGLRDESMILSKVIELQTVIMTAQSSAMKAQIDYQETLERVRELEKEKAALETWDQEKRRYELKELPPGVFIYVLKPEAANGEPSHRLCPKCFANGKKSILHSSGVDMGLEYMRCLECDAKITAGKFIPLPRDPGGGSWMV